MKHAAMVIGLQVAEYHFMYCKEDGDDIETESKQKQKMENRILPLFRV
jgi:hypothetical protein